MTSLEKEVRDLVESFDSFPPLQVQEEALVRAADRANIVKLHLALGLSTDTEPSVERIQNFVGARFDVRAWIVNTKNYNFDFFHQPAARITVYTWRQVGYINVYGTEAERDYQIFKVNQVLQGSEDFLHVLETKETSVSSDLKIAIDKSFSVVFDLDKLPWPPAPAKPPRRTDYLEDVAARFRLIENPAKGDCYRQAVKTAQRFGGDVVHGTVFQRGKRFEHAWAELEDNVVLNTNGGFVSKARFYAETQAEPEARYPWAKALANSARHGHWGPW